MEKFDDNLELLQGFVEEGLEMLDEVEPKIVELEKTALSSGEVDSEVINTIFRLFHSLKGGAGFLNLEVIKKVTHEAETLLDLFRKGKAQLQSEHIDLMTVTCDLLRTLLNAVAEHQTDTGYEQESSEIFQMLQKTVSNLSGNKTVSVHPTPKPADTPPEKPILIDLESPLPEELQPEKPPVPKISGFDVTPELVQQFINEGLELLESAESALLLLEKSPEDKENIDRAFRAIHSFKGNSGFLGFGELQSLSHQAENLLDKIRAGSLQAVPDIFSLLLEVIDFLRSGVNLLFDNKEPKVKGYQGLIHLMTDTAAKYAVVSQNLPSAEIVDEIPAIDEEKTKPDEPEKQAASVKEKISKPDDDKKSSASDQRQSIRVDVVKLDKLLDLVGEMVIVEAMVTQNPEIKRQRERMDRLEKSLMQLDKITRDLQDISTSIRMIPLAATFKRMIRLVRDLSQKAGKKVKLEILGEETEVDKTVIEQISDPLVHIIRNAIDHGIDSPDDRKKRGKSESGVLKIDAKHVGGEVWIMVTDDGRGLDREKILAKAAEKGLIDGDGADLKDEQVWDLIFLPGFSTAAKITDVSGRGVGMDVVKRNIEAIRGRTEVRSKKGEGTTVIMRIPLTLAIIDGMIIRLGSSQYIIPIIDIKESFRPNQKQLTTVADGSSIVNIRGQLLPVIRVNELFGVRMDSANFCEGIMIVVENQGTTACIFVDELVGQQQVVIKGLPQYVDNIKYISGCTILGDGAVSLIIDIASITELIKNITEI